MSAIRSEERGLHRSTDTEAESHCYRKCNGSVVVIASWNVRLRRPRSPRRSKSAVVLAIDLVKSIAWRLLEAWMGRMKAVLKGTVLAESDDIVMVDGNPYFPRSAMRQEFFRDSSHTTVCGWKGTDRYWDVVLADQVITNAVWSYETPKPDAETIRERFSFYRGKGVELS